MSRAKQQLRQQLRRQCRSLTSEQRLSLSQHISEHFLSSSCLDAVHVVALFWGLEGLGEASTEFVFESLLARGCRIAFPRVDGRELDFRLVTSADEMLLSTQGLVEPASDAPRVSAAEIDLIVVPGLGFGPQGERLGRGGGYYDRLLSRPEFTAPAIGWAYSFQQVAAVPMDTHDCCVNGVATEQGLVIYPPAQ